MSILQPESGIWFAVCFLVVIARIISRRIHRRAWKNLQVDDYLIVLALCTDAVLVSVMQIVVKHNSNLIAPGDDVSTFSHEEIQSRIYGSKLVLVVEQMQILTIWLVKYCLLLMYNRITLLLPQHKIVIGTAIYATFGFVLMEILYFAVWCRPFSQYWAVPPNNVQCSAATNHLITNAVLNITSDLFIISIPMPLLFKVALRLRNKIILSGMFLLGTFTIVAAVLNKYYSFSHPFGLEWTIWYLRESFTAILCANLPLTYPLIQRVFKLQDWSNVSHVSGQYGIGSQHRHTLSTGEGNTKSSRIQAVPRSYSRGRARTNTQSEEAIIRGLSDSSIAHDNTVFITSAIPLIDLQSPRGEPSTGSGNVWGRGSERDEMLSNDDAV